MKATKLQRNTFNYLMDLKLLQLVDQDHSTKDLLLMQSSDVTRNVVTFDNKNH